MDIKISNCSRNALKVLLSGELENEYGDNVLSKISSYLISYEDFRSIILCNEDYVSLQEFILNEFKLFGKKCKLMQLDMFVKHCYSLYSKNCTSYLSKVLNSKDLEYIFDRKSLIKVLNFINAKKGN